jgi:hypothetical protein
MSISMKNGSLRPNCQRCCGKFSLNLAVVAGSRGALIAIGGGLGIHLNVIGGAYEVSLEN